VDNHKQANGIRLGVGLDSSYRQESISTMPDSGARITYGLNSVGNITGTTNYLDTLANRTFSYDDIYRLTQARSLDYPDTLQKYVYAKNGNRDTVLSYGSTGIDTARYSYSNNRLTQVTGANGMTFSYDTLGNVTRQIQGVDTLTFQYIKAG
jgi:hypothetical protein